MLKKTLSLVLSLALLLLAFAACSRKEPTKETEMVTTASDGREMEGNMYTSGLPIVKDKVTLKMVANKRVINGNFEEMIFLERLEEKTNVRVEFDAIPAAQYNDKKNIMLASNELPDAFFGPFAFSANDIVTSSTQGTIVPLEGLVEKYGPRITAAYEKHPEYKKFCTAPDGHIYSIGRVIQDPGGVCADNLFIYKPWLDKLGLQVPDSMDDLYNVLKAFKEGDPNENGKPDEIPMTFILNTTSYALNIMSLYGLFGFIDNPANHLMLDKDKVVFVAAKLAYKDAMKYFNKMFNEGLFDAEAFTQDSKQITAKGQAADVIIGSYFAWNDFDVAGAERAKDYIIVPPMKGVDGQRVWGRASLSGLNNVGFVITNKNQYPEITMRWVDEFFDPITSCEALYGPLDVNLTLKPGGTLDFLPTPQGMTYDEFRFKNTPTDVPAAIFAEDYGNLIPLPANAAKKAKDVEENYLPYAVYDIYPGFMMSLDATERLKVLSTDIRNCVWDYQSKWLMDGGIDAEWDAYLAKLKQLNLDEYVKIHQDELDRFNQTK